MFQRNGMEVPVFNAKETLKVITELCLVSYKGYLGPYFKENIKNIAKNNSVRIMGYKNIPTTDNELSEDECWDIYENLLFKHFKNQWNDELFLKIMSDVHKNNYVIFAVYANEDDFNIMTEFGSNSVKKGLT